jgi:hypothetical protein
MLVSLFQRMQGDAYPRVLMNAPGVTIYTTASSALSHLLLCNNHFTCCHLVYGCNEYDQLLHDDPTGI